MKRKIRKFGILCLLGMIFLSSTFSTIHAQATEQREAITYSGDAQEETSYETKEQELKTIGANEELLPYITGFSFEDKDGRSFGDDHKIPIDKNTKVKLTYTFDFPDTLTIGKDQKFQLQMPDYFLLGDAGIAETKLESNHDIHAVWSVSQLGLITITFKEEVTKSAISGGIVIDTFVDKEKIDTETIDFGLGSIPSVVSIYPTAYIPAGEIKKTTDKNAFDKKTKEITWKLIVTPKENTKNLKGFTITDIFAKNEEQSFVLSSLVDVTTGIPLQPDAVNDEAFSYTFPEDTIDGVHTITYRTKVQEAFYLSDAEKIENLAKLIKDSKEVSSSSTSLQNIKQPVLEKKAGNYDPVSKKIAYTMIVNKDQREITNMSIKDMHPLQTKMENIQVYALNAQGTAYTEEVIPTSITHTQKADGIETDIVLGTMDKELQITYDMEILDLDTFIIDKNDYNKGYQVVNTARVVSDQNVLKTVSVTKKIAIGQGDGRASFSKQGRVIYGDPQTNQNGSTIEWTIKINANQANLQKAGDFQDTLPSYLSYIPDSFTVNGIAKDGMYEEATRTLRYHIDEIGTQTYTIIFRTRIDNWNTDKEQNGHISVKNEASFTVDGEVQKASHDPQLKLGTMLSKSGTFDNETQVFTWEIKVNQNQVAIKKVEILDILPQGHSLLMGSITYSGNETNHWKITQNGQEVRFAYHQGGMLCQDTTISFQTKYTLNQGVLPNEYTAQNEVKMTSSNTSGLTATASVPVSYLPSVTKTTTYKSGTIIPWSVGINYNGAYLVKDEAVLVDQLQPGLALDTNSVTLYQYKTGSTGEKIVIDVPRENISYDELTREFRFTMPKGIDLHKAYDLTFSTNVTILSLDEVTNVISFDGSRQDTISHAGRIPLAISGSSGFVKGENITVSLIKQTEDNVPLKDATFKISSIDGANDYIEDTQTTDEDGYLSFQADLKYEHAYIITEQQAPKGYKLMKPIALYIDKKTTEDGKNFANVTFNGTTKKVYTDAYGFLDISEIVINEAIEIGVQKVDDTQDAKPVMDAELGIYHLDGTLAKDLHGTACSWLSDGTVKVWEGIPAGDYVLKETSAPAGHFKAADMYFTIDASGNITRIDQQPNQGNVLTMVDATTNVSIQKKAAGVPLANASLQIVDEERNVIDAWISDENPHIIRGKLEADTTYILQEIVPPAGYASAEDISFTTRTDAQVQEIIMVDQALQIEIAKLESAHGQPLEGAKLAVYDQANVLIETWTSTHEPYRMKEKLEVNESYILREEEAPSGFHKAEDQNFMVKDTKELQTVTMKDTPTRIRIEKIDAETREPLIGAKLGIYDEENVLVEAWTSKKEAHEIIGKLVVGKTYTLREEEAPAGYHKAEDLSFMISETEEIQTITMKDIPTKISIIKIDAETEEPLMGAKLAIYDENKDFIETWTSDKESYRIIGKLIEGETYTLREEEAPLGYQKAEDISFKINDEVDEQVIVMKDEISSITDAPQDIVSTGDTTSLYGLLCICIGSLLFLIKVKHGIDN